MGSENRRHESGVVVVVGGGLTWGAGWGGGRGDAGRGASRTHASETNRMKND